MTGVVVASNGCRGGGNSGKKTKGEVDRSESQLSIVALMMATIRKSMIYCRMSFREEEVMSAVEGMDIGWPTEVQHVAHVTFDRFKGFLGLPVEFELEVSCRAPSASASVFGVSPKLMQCGFDSEGNSVPIILLLMQERLYSQGGLKAEGIFRITAENSEEKDLRNQLNKGIIPDDIDVHCLAGLIKAWFRELPEGVLDSLSPAQVLQCETEEDCVELVKLLPPMQFALVKWVSDLMADIVEEEEANKMNARNIAMVFAPNMTQLSDPLTSLMHAVHVMNLLQTLIFRTLREREEEAEARENDWPFSCSSYDGGDHETDELMESSSDNDCEVDVSGELRRDTSKKFQVKNADRNIDEDENVEQIEECFLRHLELDLEGGNGDLEKELFRPDMDFGYQATNFSSAELSSSDSSATKSESSRSTSSRRISEVHHVAIVPGDVVANAKPSDPVEDGKELEMDKEIIRNLVDSGDQVTKLSFTELNSSGSSIMKSESNQSTTSRTINDVVLDSDTIVAEDEAGDVELLDPVRDGKELEMDVDALKGCCHNQNMSAH